MSLAEIEAELEKLGLDELRSLALKSWAAYLQKERHAASSNSCTEDDPVLLSALDQAIAEADATPGQGLSAKEALAKLKEWTTK